MSRLWREVTYKSSLFGKLYIWGWHGETTENKTCHLHSFSPIQWQRIYLLLWNHSTAWDTLHTKIKGWRMLSYISYFYHHSEANCSLILPTSPFLPWFNWTWFIFELTSFNPFPTKKANPLWVTSSAAHHPAVKPKGRPAWQPQPAQGGEG